MAKNTAILAVGNFSSKLLTFLLVPLYTAYLSTADYGSYDIIYSTMSLLIPLLTLNIADAMLRFPMEDDADATRICHIGLIVTLLGSLLVFVGSQVPFISSGSIGGIRYAAPMFLVNALYQLLVLFARGTNRFVLIAVAGVISSLSIIAFAVILIIWLHLGLDGIFISNIAGMAFAVLFLAFMFRREIFAKSRSTQPGLLGKMVRYSFPLCLTLVGWWLINTAGRYIVLLVCGLGANGLYSVSAKIPAILTVVTNIFLQAWQVSGIEELTRGGDGSYIKKVFKSAEASVVALCSFCIACTPLIASFMFQNDFYVAWVFVPFQLVFVVVNTMGGMWGPIFSARYDTKPMAVSTLIGGLVSLVLGVILAYFIGIQGVAVASLLGGLANWLWRGRKAEEYSSIDFGMGRSLRLYLVLSLQGLLLVIMPEGAVSGLIQFGFVVLICVACRSGIVPLIKQTLSAIRQSISRAH